MSKILSILVLNQCEDITHTEARTVVSAINTQLSKHFLPAWNISARCKLAPKSGSKVNINKVSEDAVMIITDKADVENAAGYHDKVVESGKTFGYVFQDVAEELEEPWSVTFSHEILELVLNRHANYYALGPHPKERKRTVAHWLEASDAVQDYSYNIKTVAVSDFVLPLYFTPESETTGKNDFLETKGLKSFGVAKGGYVGFWDPKTGHEETTMADKRAIKRHQIKEEMGRFRRSKRRT